MALTLPDGRSLDLHCPRIVGVLNVTPDSFSDGGAYRSADDAADAALRMLDDGADVIDVGGESTRPGAQRIDAGEQIRRVVPVIRSIMRDAKRTGRPMPLLSIDTTRAAVAEAALDAGAQIINDISAGREDAAMFALAAARSAPMILMHMQGVPATMQDQPHYTDVVAEVKAFLMERSAKAEQAGLSRTAIVIDPGLGFGKTTAHNLRLLACLSDFVAGGYPVMLGASRKRFIGQITGVAEPVERVAGVCATTAIGVLAGVRLFRVHDVAINRQAADAAFAIVESRPAVP